jgi:hypothetical protein
MLGRSDRWAVSYGDGGPANPGARLRLRCAAIARNERAVQEIRTAWVLRRRGEEEIKRELNDEEPSHYTGT